MNETQRKRRGHQFMPVKSVMDKMPAIGATEKTPAADKIIYAHYFSAAGDWWVAEMDPATDEAFGYAQLASYPEGAEWGYYDLTELEELSVHSGLVIVERDMYWTPTRFGELNINRR